MNILTLIIDGLSARTINGVWYTTYFKKTIQPISLSVTVGQHLRNQRQPRLLMTIHLVKH